MEVFLAIMSSISKENFKSNSRFSLKTSMGKYSFEENDRQSWATLQRKVCENNSRGKFYVTRNV